MDKLQSVALKGCL